MFNLLSGEFYKCRKSRSFVVCCLVVIVFVMFIYGCLWMAERIQKGEMNNGTAAVVVEVDETQEVQFVDIAQILFGVVGCVVTAVFVSIFVIGEYTNGAIKNVVGKGKPRSRIFLAKYIMSVLASVAILFAGVVATLIGGLIFLGTDSFNAEMIKNLCQYSVVQFLLGAALAGIVVSIGEMSRSLGVGIAVSVGVLTMSDLLFMGIDLLFHKVDFTPSNYWIMNLSSQCPVNGVGSDFLGKVIISVIFWMAVSIAIGMLHFKKADVK